MLTLHALLFFLFSMSVVAAPGLLLAKYDTDKPQKPPSKPSSPHIPQEAYGCWYRLSGGHRPVSIMLLKPIFYLSHSHYTDHIG